MFWTLYFWTGFWSYIITAVYSRHHGVFPSLFRLGQISLFWHISAFVFFWPLALPLSYFEIRQKIRERFDAESQKNSAPPKTPNP